MCNNDDGKEGRCPMGRSVFTPKKVEIIETENLLNSQNESLEEEVIQEANDDIFSSFENAILSAAQIPKRRPTFGEVYLDLAIALSRRSTCSRRHVGCAIVSNDYRRVLSVGYNGNAIGLENKCDSPDASGACGCLHAEENAVISCSESISTQKIVFTTVYPCKMCAKRIIQLGNVQRVYYMDEYRNDDAAEIFDKAGILVSKISPYGGSDV